jgi:hypothetical protein
VTCVAYDPATLNVWTGCADGSVLLHARGRWGFASLATEVGLPVRAMAVDSSHCCWVGDEAGIIRVLTLDIITDRLGVRFRVIPPQARGLVRLATSQGPAAAAPAASGPPGAAGKCVPVHAMLGRGPAVFASGSKAWDSITVFNSQNYQVLEVANCESFGATCCFAVLPWETDDAEQQAAAAFAGEGGDRGTCLFTCGLTQAPAMLRSSAACELQLSAPLKCVKCLPSYTGCRGGVMSALGHC